jgi:hypothetical protein
MEELSHVDWPTLVLGIILGIPVAYIIGIIAHMHAMRLTHFIDNRRLIRKYKTKKQALLVFNRIKAFREGKRDRYPFYLILASAAISCAIAASTLILIAFIQQGFSIELRMILLLFALIAVMVVLILFGGLYETARQVERFDDYKVEFEKRWGTIDSESA